MGYFDADSDLPIPDRRAKESDRLAYGNQIVDRGMAFLRAQPAAADIQKGRNIVHAMETYDEALSDKLSHVRLPRIKRNVRELVATLSNLRPTWDYVSNNPTLYEEQANVLNKLNKAWFYNEEVDRSIRQALQFAATEGTGYLYLTYEKPLRAKTGRIKLTPLGAMSYIPFQQGLDNKVQNAEAGIVCTEIPLQRARRLYRRNDLQPTNSTATNLVQGGGVRGMITNMVGSVYMAATGANRNKNAGANVPTINIYHIYLKDDSINESGAPIKMGNFSADGKPLDNYSYVVPSLGDPIPTGRMMPEHTDLGPAVNPLTGDIQLTEETRPAEASDCMLYPNLRLIIMSPDTLIYDGPSMFWHGKIPIVQFRLDDWPWNFLGFSLVRDTWRLEESITARLRARDDATNARLNPALMYDSRMSEEFDKNFTPRIPGGRIVKPPSLMSDRPVESVLPQEFYTVSPNADAEIMADEERLDFLMGIPAVKELMKLQQMPQSDSLDKILGASNAIIVDLARNMEASLRELGEMWKGMAFQFCTTHERLQLLGENGLTMEDFDFDPGNMIPAHLPGEDPTKASRASRTERARHHLDSFRFNVVPNSLAQISAITRKLLFTQMWRDKTFPLDPWTYAEIMEVGNFGVPPPEAKNVVEKWLAWQKVIMQLQGQAEDLVAKREGRPPSGQAPPAVKARPDLSTTITESR